VFNKIVAKTTTVDSSIVTLNRLPHTGRGSFTPGYSHAGWSEWVYDAIQVDSFTQAHSSHAALLSIILHF